MKVGGFQLWPEQTGSTIKGTTATSGGGSAGTPIQQQMYSAANETISNNTGPVGFTHNFVLAAPPYSKGGTFRFKFLGTVSCTGTPTFRLQPYWTSGSNVISDSGVYTLANNLAFGLWQVNGAWVLDESGNLKDAGTIFYMPTAAYPSAAVVILSNIGNVAFSGTGPIGLQIRFSAADPANTVTLNEAYMDYFPPGAHS